MEETQAAPEEEAIAASPEPPKKEETNIRRESEELVDKAVSQGKTDENGETKEKEVNPEEVKRTVEIAKSIQASKEKASKLSRMGKIQEIAGKYLEGRLNDMLKNGLDDVWKAAGIDDEEVRKRARAVIRGYITAESSLSPDIIKAKMKISNELLKLVESQIKNLSGFKTEEINKALNTFNNYADEIDKAEKRLSDRIDKAIEKTSKWTDQDNMEAIDKFISGLDRAIERGGKSLSHKLDDKINNNPLMKQLGITFKSERLLGKTFESIEKKISVPLEKKLKPYLQKNVKKLTAMVTHINKRLVEIKKMEDRIKNEIKKQEEFAKQFAETKLKEFASDIASKVNISVGSLGGDIGSSIKLGF